MQTADNKHGQSCSAWPVVEAMRAELGVIPWQAGAIRSQVCSNSLKSHRADLPTWEMFMIVFDGKIPLLGINSRSMQRSMFTAVYFLKNPNRAGMT